MYALKSQDMKRIDRFMAETMGISENVLMENAAKSVVDVLMEETYREATYNGVVLFCGSGNNGGDGYAIARWLCHNNVNVTVYSVGNVEHMGKETLSNYHCCEQMALSRPEQFRMHSLETEVSLWEEEVRFQISRAGIIVDAMLGTGCQRVLSPVYSHIVDLINDGRAPIVSVDVPTGVNSDNGKVMGKAVQAAVTITFGCPKLGLILFPAVDYVGELRVADIGILDEAFAIVTDPIELLLPETMESQPFKRVFSRPENSHKGVFGTVGVIAGDASMLGATILVAKAAYRSGAGLVKIMAEEAFAQILIQQLPEAIVVTYGSHMTKDEYNNFIYTFCHSVNVIAIGSGLSKSLRAQHLVAEVLMSEIKVVMDADGLNIISEHPEWLEQRRCELIMTPHIGEMARLTGYPSSGILENPLPIAKAYSTKNRVTVVLKSARTVISDKEGTCYINCMGNSGMATGGSGDVLAGTIAGCVAQGLSLKEAAVYGTALHSFAGDQAICDKEKTTTTRGHRMLATDIIEHLWVGVDGGQ